MWKYLRIAATVTAAMVFGTLSVRPAFAQQLLAGFEQTLNTTAGGAPFFGYSIVGPEYTTTAGVTEGTSALVLHHAPDWITDGFRVAGGMPLAQLTATHDAVQFDLTTTDYGVAGDGWSPSWRVGWVIFQGSVGGWHQSAQFQPTVASDDGGSFTQNITVELDTVLTQTATPTGAKTDAQTYVSTGGGTNPQWDMLIVLIGGEQGTAIQPKPGDYSPDLLVGAPDYVTWRKTFGGTTLPNETASPGSVDAEDYTVWRANYGNDYSRVTTIIDNIRFANAGSGSGSLSQGAIPEPSSLIMALAAGLALAAGRRVRSSKIS